MNGFSITETKILDFVQKSVPLCSRPFTEIGKQTGHSESEVIDTLADLRQKGIIRNIAGIFAGEKLGYHLSLVALSLDNSDIEKAAEFVSSHPGVSHNYGREHEYNLWFTLACETEDALEKNVKLIAEKTGAKDSLILRNEKLYKIGVILPIGENKQPPMKSADSTNSNEFTPADIPAVKFLQHDLPLVKEPFKKILEDNESEVSENELLSAAERLLSGKIMRRYSAVLRHTKAGFSHNAMSAWKTPADFDSAEKYKCFVNTQEVTHLYMRTVFPGRWEYPLFAMIHARSEDELQNIIGRLSEESKIDDYIVLKTLKEYKKQRVIYFSDEFAKWERKNND